MKNIWKILPLVLVLILAPLVRVANAQQQMTQVDRVKADVDKRLSSKKEKVVVKLQNGSEIKGSLVQSGNNTFTLTDSKSGRQTEVAFADVTKVKGQGLGKWTKVAIFTGIGVAVVVIVLAIAVTRIDVLDGPIPIHLP